MLRGFVVLVWFCQMSSITNNITSKNPVQILVSQELSFTKQENSGQILSLVNRRNGAGRMANNQQKFTKMKLLLDSDRHWTMTPLTD